MLTVLCIVLQEKNVSFDSLEGKVGRVYMPKQDLGSMALNKMKVRQELLQEVLWRQCKCPCITPLHVHACLHWHCQQQ